MAKPTVLGVVTARAGSKGIPGKNTKLLAGKPLIAYTIEAALASGVFDRLILTTDDECAARIARDLGCEVPFMRPAELAADDAPEWLAWRHAVRTLDATGGRRKVDVLVAVPTTSPLRVARDVDACVETLLESDADVVITVTPAARSPYYNMVVLDEGYARPVIHPSGPLHRRQDAPRVFDMTTVAYAARAGYVVSAEGLFDGKVRAVMVPRERALDIDTELDLEIAEFLAHRSGGPRRP